MKICYKRISKINLKQLLFAIVTIIFLYLVLVNINIKETLNIIKGFDLKYTFLLSLSLIISLSFRGLCLKQILSNSINTSLIELIQLCITGAGLNIILPARAGDLFRVYYIGNKYNINKVKILGAIALERMFDGLCIILMLLTAIIFYNKNELAQKLCLSSLILFPSCFIASIIMCKFNKIEQICNFFEKKLKKFPQKIGQFLIRIIHILNNACNSFFNGFEILKYPGKTFSILLSVIGIWIFECLNYYIVIQGFGCDIHWSVVLYIISFIALSTMIPSTSIFIGPYQFAVISAFSIYNINKETALAISIVEQSIVTITTLTIAAVFLINKNISFKTIKNDSEKKL